MVLFNNENFISGTFPNNEKKYIDLTSSLRRTPRNIITLIYEGNEDLFDLAMMKHWFDDNMTDSSTIELRMSFCPYGQSDRKMDGAILSFKYFADFINSLNFDRVTIYDPHSPVMECAIKKCVVKYPLADKVLLNSYDMLFYPDAGAAKKYSEIYDMPYRYGNKKRELSTGNILYYEVIANKKDIEGKKILILDDLCLGGTTFKEAAKVLKNNMGAKQVDLHITHLMSIAENFYKNHEDFGITNFYSVNTLKQDWYKG